MTVRPDTPARDGDILDTLFRFPIANLESKILRLDIELKNRHNMRDKTLSSLGTHKLALEDVMFRARYAPVTTHGGIRGQILTVEALGWAEHRLSAKDTASLTESLQEVRDALTTAHLKRSLVMYGAS